MDLISFDFLTFIPVIYFAHFLLPIDLTPPAVTK